jgi:hypothetical protein
MVIPFIFACIEHFKARKRRPYEEAREQLLESQRTLEQLRDREKDLVEVATSLVQQNRVKDLVPVLAELHKTRAWIKTTTELDRVQSAAIRAYEEKQRPEVHAIRQRVETTRKILGEREETKDAQRDLEMDAFEDVREARNAAAADLEEEIARAADMAAEDTGEAAALQAVADALPSLGEEEKELILSGAGDGSDIVLDRNAKKKLIAAIVGGGRPISLPGAAAAGQEGGEGEKAKSKKRKKKAEKDEEEAAAVISALPSVPAAAAAAPPPAPLSMQSLPLALV